MKDILMMKKTHNSLLPLRGKISPPTILNCLNHSTEQKNYKSRETTKPVGGRERLFSASSMSAYSSKHGSTISDINLTPPFTPPANDDRAFLFRRPSEHFLEVLEEHKQRPTVPKVRSSSCLPPLGKTTQGEDSAQKRNLRGTQIAFSGYLNGEDAVSRQVESNGGRLLISEQRSDPTATNLANKKMLRKSHSLPLIKPCTAFTAGIDCVNVSVAGGHTPTDISIEEQKLNTCDRADNAPIKEYLEEMCDDESDALDHNDEEETLEKFSMICDWLKECEKAKVV